MALDGIELLEGLPAWGCQGATDPPQQLAVGCRRTRRILLTTPRLPRVPSHIRRTLKSPCGLRPCPPLKLYVRSREGLPRRPRPQSTGSSVTGTRSYSPIGGARNAMSALGAGRQAAQQRLLSYTLLVVFLVSMAPETVAAQPRQAAGVTGDSGAPRASGGSRLAQARPPPPRARPPPPKPKTPRHAKPRWWLCVCRWLG